jgi:hypothetical protein
MYMYVHVQVHVHVWLDLVIIKLAIFSYGARYTLYMQPYIYHHLCNACMIKTVVIEDC